MSPSTGERLLQDSPKVLVVGTTPDYVDWIRKSCPGRALFLTEPAVRRRAEEPCPAPWEELLCDLSDYAQATQLLERHLLEEKLELGGIVSFDCESMELAAVLAQSCRLRYPSVQAVRNCRDKYLSKTLWQKQGLHTPRNMLVRSATEAADFFRETGGACVLKPLSGSGSELIFRCNSPDECEQGFVGIRNGLQQRQAQRLYRPSGDDATAILAEECVYGREYSCDFIIEDGRVDIIRLTCKILSPREPFGTAMGYYLPAVMPEEIDESSLRTTLYRSAAALGLDRALCMLDFMISNGRLVLLELAPRPGGDCLPFLLRRSQGLDILKLFLDFSQQKPRELNHCGNQRDWVGLRLHARQSGCLKKIDTQLLQQDARVHEIHLIRKPGHAIKLPPADYDSWLLGHIIFEPDAAAQPAAQCRELLEKLILKID
jgi:biotin carboxylase